MLGTMVSSVFENKQNGQNVQNEQNEERELTTFFRFVSFRFLPHYNIINTTWGFRWLRLVHLASPVVHATRYAYHHIVNEPSVTRRITNHNPTMINHMTNHQNTQHHTTISPFAIYNTEIHKPPSYIHHTTDSHKSNLNICTNTSKQTILRHTSMIHQFVFITTRCTSCTTEISRIQ